MDVNIDQPRRDDRPGDIDYLGAGRIEILADRSDFPILDSDVVDAIDGLRAIDHASALEHSVESLSHEEAPPVRRPALFIRDRRPL